MVLRLIDRIIRAVRGWFSRPARDAETGRNVTQDVSDDIATSCLRGIRAAKWILPDGLVNTLAFKPDPRTAATRTDRACETSVNWEDTAGVLAFTLSDRQNAEHGAARLAR